PARARLDLLPRPERHPARSMLPARGRRAAPGDPLGGAAARRRAARAGKHRPGVGRGYNRGGEVQMSANPQAAATGIAHARVVPMGNGWNWIASAWPIFRRAAGVWIGMVVVLLLIIIVAHLIPFIGAVAIQILWPV